MDDVYDPLTNGNYVQTSVTQSKDQWTKFGAGWDKIKPKSCSAVTLSKVKHDPVAP